MNSLLQLSQHRWLRANLPVALLATLLQRTPVLRIVAGAETVLVGSPIGAWLKAAVATGASLGTIHSLAGATVLVATQASPVNSTTSSNVQIGFTVTDTINIASWSIGGNIPPGLTFSAAEGGGTLNAPGVLDATTGGGDDGYGGVSMGNNTTTPRLSGTPTQAGSFTFTLQAFEMSSLGGLPSKIFPYTINVAGAPPTNVAPSFTTQPAPQSVTVGSSITLTSAAQGTPAPTYQWQKNGVAIAGATTATLTLNNVQLSDAATYTVVASNAAGNVTSNVTVAITNPTSGNTAPAIARAPAGRTISINSTVVFSVEATGTPAPTYQWRRNGAAITGATSRMLVVASATNANAGAYSVAITNASGSVETTPVSLTVLNEPRFGHLSNLSIGTKFTATDRSFSVGTYLGGGTAASMGVLIRAIGPSLGIAPFGIPTALTDSKLTVSTGGKVVAENDDWNLNATTSAVFAPAGAFPLASPKDGVVFNPAFASGGYVIEVSAAAGANGEDVIAELYDTTSADKFSASGLRLINVSVGKVVPTGGLLNAGFYIDGNTARTVLIRAIGPGLAAAPFNLSGTMPDPQLTLASGQTVIAENDNWGGDAQITAFGATNGAFAIADGANKDAMIMLTLSPGGYVATAKPNGSGGYVLMEVYEIP